MNIEILKGKGDKMIKNITEQEKATEQEKLTKLWNEIFKLPYILDFINTTPNIKGESIENFNIVLYVVLSYLITEITDLEKLRNIKTFKNLIWFYRVNRLEPLYKGSFQTLKERENNLNDFCVKFNISEEERDTIQNEINNLPNEKLTILAYTDNLYLNKNEGRNYNDLTAKEVYKLAYASYLWCIREQEEHERDIKLYKDFEFKNESNKERVNKLVNDGVSLYIEYLEIKTAKDNERLNPHLIAVNDGGDIGQAFLTTIRDRQPLNTENKNDLITIEYVNKVLNDYALKVNNLAKIQSVLDSESEEYKNIEEQKDILYSERGRKTKDFIKFEGLIYAFNEDGYHAYLDKDNYYIITMVLEDGTERPIFRVLPRIWVKRSKYFFTAQQYLFLLATRKGTDFELTYEDLKSDFNIDTKRGKDGKKNQWDYFINEFQEALSQLATTFYIDKKKMASTLIFISELQNKGKGWRININYGFYNYMIDNNFKTLISRHVFKEGLNDRQLKLYVGIIQHICKERVNNPRDFSYKFSFNFLIKLGGYYNEKDLLHATNGDKEALKKRKHKENQKLLKDLEGICDNYRPSLFKDSKCLKHFLIISNLNPKGRKKEFTIMDYYLKDLKALEKEFLKCCEKNETPINQ